MIGTSLIGGLDTGLRGAAIALFLLIAVAVLRRGGGRPVAWLGAALSVGAAAYVLCSLPDHPRSPWFSSPGGDLRRKCRGVLAVHARGVRRFLPADAMACRVVAAACHLFANGFIRHRCRRELAAGGGVAPCACSLCSSRRGSDRHGLARRPGRGPSPAAVVHPGRGRAAHGSLSRCRHFNRSRPRSSGCPSAQCRRSVVDRRGDRRGAAACRSGGISGRFRPTGSGGDPGGSAGGGAGRSGCAERARAPDDGRAAVPPRGPHHRRPCGQARPARAPAAADHQPRPGLPELQRVPQPPSPGRRQAGPRRPGAARRPHPDHRPGCRLPVAFPVQSGLQGRHRRDPTEFRRQAEGSGGD